MACDEHYDKTIRDNVDRYGRSRCARDTRADGPGAPEQHGGGVSDTEPDNDGIDGPSYCSGQRDSSEPSVSDSSGGDIGDIHSGDRPDQRFGDDHARQQCGDGPDVSLQYRRVIQVPPHEVWLAWPFVKDMLAKSMHYGEAPYTLTDLYLDCIDGHATLWTLAKGNAVIGAGIAAIDNWRSARILSLRVGGSTDMRACVHELLGAVEAWGRAQGCTRMHFSGRRGWARVLGGRVVGYCMSKDL